jgi:hypothetical protein
VTLSHPFRYPSAVAFGSTVGLVLALFWPLLVDQAERATDHWLPVVRGAAAPVYKTDGSVTIRLTLTKLRDCKYLQVHAYSRMPNGTLRDASAARRDRAEVGVTRPAGQAFDAGLWELWPTDGAVAALLYAQHDCDGRLVSSLLAEVKL